MSTSRLPVVFLPHGGGPWPFVELGFGSKRENDALRAYLEGVARAPKSAPKALLVISAHWEEESPTLMTGAQPPLLFDYYGFPPESYRLTWPAPGAPALVERVDGLLRAAGFHPQHDGRRGFDHGTFVPLKLAYPAPTIPTLQLSLKAGLDPAEFESLGKRYLERTRVQRKLGRPFFIDKMPNNFRHIGLIHLMLPNAKIIDARREPMACCFSNFKQLFASGQEFTYGIEDIARYYRSYVELMAHWDTVLPGRYGLFTTGAAEYLKIGSVLSSDSGSVNSATRW